jgi:hypothetical protein
MQLPIYQSEEEQRLMVELWARVIEGTVIDG